MAEHGSTPPLTDEILAQIARVRRDFEAAWKSDKRPELGRVMADVQEPLRSALLRELVLLDIEYRRKQGKTPSIGEYLAQFPGDVALLEALGRSRGSEAALEGMTTQSYVASPGVDVSGLRVGPYKLLGVLGEGGFGTVYLAEQQHPLNRRVALKVVKAGMDTKQVLARFEAERQALAIMDHPNIAKVFDAGTNEAGRSYFVMELVHGEPITAYCDRLKLTLEERLGLFIPVCQAVQHAHQKGVIHRDLKPSNVLVTVIDDRPIPKVIDFGVAKAVARPLCEQTIFTEQGQLIGTPEYMSPEQAEMTNLDIDTRSDVYSLGVLLYELLTGHLPFDRKMLRRAGFDEIRRIIREVEPPKPSTKLSSIGESCLALAEKRRIDPGALRRRLRRELDWITMRAMEKDRTRRYTTALDLAVDVQRYLKHEPVQAGPPGNVYRLLKFARRHRRALVAGFLLAAAAAVFMALALTAESRARAVAMRRNQEAARSLKKDANGLLEKGDFKGAEEAFARALGLDETDASARESIARARREDEIARITALVKEHVEYARFDQALGVAEVGRIRFPDEKRTRDLVRLAAGTARLRVASGFGAVLSATLRSIASRSAHTEIRVIGAQLAGPDGIDIAPGWHLLTVHYQPSADDRAKPVARSYVLLVRRSVPYELDMRRITVGSFEGADFPTLKDALRNAKPGHVLALGPGEHDARRVTITTSNLTIESLDKNKTASIWVDRHTSRLIISDTWDIQLLNVDFEGKNSDNSAWPGHIDFKQCAFCRLSDCKLVGATVDATQCDGLTVSSNIFTSRDGQWIHHRSNVDDSRRVFLLDNLVERTGPVGHRTFSFSNCTGIFVVGNEIARSGLNGLNFSNCSDIVVVGNQVTYHHEGNIALDSSRKALLAFNEFASKAQYNVLLLASREASLLHNWLTGGDSSIVLRASGNSHYGYNSISDSATAFRFAGSAFNDIYGNVLQRNKTTFVGEGSYWGGACFERNVTDRPIEAQKLGNTRIREGVGNIIGKVGQGEPIGASGRRALLQLDGERLVVLDGDTGQFGPASGLKDEYLAWWRAQAAAFHVAMVSGKTTPCNPALGEWLCHQSQSSLDAMKDLVALLPETGQRLAKPAAAPQDQPKSSSGPENGPELAAPAADEAADAISAAMVIDGPADLGRTAALGQLKQRISGVFSVTADEQRKVLAAVTDYLSTRSAKPPTDDDVVLAISAARAIEGTDNTALAVEAYGTIAGLLCPSGSPPLSPAAQTLRGAAYRLGLIGKQLDFQARTAAGSIFDLAAHRGKTVLLCFWASWSPSWGEELPNVELQRSLYRGRGLEVVGINLESKPELSAHGLDLAKFPLTTIHDVDQEGAHPLARRFGIVSVPTAILIDRAGKVVSIRARGEELGRLLEQALGPPFRPAGKVSFVDLGLQASLLLSDAKDVPANDFAELPRGVRTFAGVPFQIRDRYLFLGNKAWPDRPRRVTGISVGKKIAKLYILHAGRTWEEPPPDGTLIGSYQVHFDDRTSETIPVVLGVDVRDWWTTSLIPVTRGALAWIGRNAKSRAQNRLIRLYLTTWENPHRQKSVVSIDFSSQQEITAPFCVAMSVEEPVEH